MELLISPDLNKMASFMLRNGYRAGRILFVPNSASQMCNSTDSAAAEMEKSWEKAKPYEEIPGPKPLPIIGNLYQFIPGIGNMGDRDLIKQQKLLMKKYGKMVRISKLPGRRDMVFLFEPKYFEEMYRQEGIWPDRDTAQMSMSYYRKVVRKDFFDGVGGVLVEFGEDWKKFRTKVNPTMMQPRVASNYLQPISEVTDDFIKRIKHIRDSKGEMPANFVNEMNKWSLESIGMIALDHRFGCLENNLKPDSEPQKMIDAVHDFLDGLETLDLRPPVWKIISTPSWRRFVKAQDFFKDTAMKHINNAIERMKGKKPGDDYEPSVLEKILLRDPNPKTACIMALDMLMAGVDTTSHSSAALLYHLSKNPNKQQHLFDELKKFLPNKNDKLTNEMMEKMKYLKACMKESMRISSIVSVMLRGTTKDIVIGDYRIPKNVNVLMPHLVMSIEESNYSEPMKFIPERWLKKKPDGKNNIGSPEDFDKLHESKAHPFTFMPFGFGPRMCIGKRFAEMEISVLICKMIRNFKIEYPYGELKFSSTLLHKPADPLKFKMIDRTD